MSIESHIQRDVQSNVVYAQDIVQDDVETTSSLLEIDGTIVVIAVSFVLFTLIMQKVFYGPVNRIRDKRHQYIKGLKSKAEEAESRADSLSEEYCEKLNVAREKVARNTAASLNEAKAEGNIIIEEKKKQVAQYIEEEKKKINQETLDTLDSLKSQVNEYAFNISKKVLGVEIPIAGDNNSIVDKILKG